MRKKDKLNVVISELYHQINITCIDALYRVVSNGDSDLLEYLRANIIVGNGISKAPNNVEVCKNINTGIIDVYSSVMDSKQAASYENTMWLLVPSKVVLPKDYDTNLFGYYSPKDYLVELYLCAADNRRIEGIKPSIINGTAKIYLSELITAVEYIADIWTQARLIENSELDPNDAQIKKCIDADYDYSQIFDKAEYAAAAIADYQKILFAASLDKLYINTDYHNWVECPGERFISEILAELDEKIDYLIYNAVIINPLHHTNEQHMTVSGIFGGAYVRATNYGVDQIHLNSNMLANENNECDLHGVEATILYGIAMYYAYEKYDILVEDALTEDEEKFFHNGAIGIISEIAKNAFNHWINLI